MPKEKEGGIAVGGQEQPQGHHLTLEISEGASGVYIAQVKEIPGIIVQADSKDKLQEEVMKSYDLYLEAFPEEHDKIFHKKQSIEYLEIQVPHYHNN